MNESLNPGKKPNAAKPNLREKAEKYLRSIVAVPLIGYGSMNAVDQGSERVQKEPVLEFSIPSEGGWEKAGGEYEKYNIWTSEKAREFLKKNPIHLDVGALAAAKDYFGKFKGIKIDASSFYKNTLIIYYFNKDGKSVKCVQLHPTEDGKFERTEFDY